MEKEFHLKKEEVHGRAVVRECERAREFYVIVVNRSKGRLLTLLHRIIKLLGFVFILSLNGDVANVAAVYAGRASGTC